jgi:hypothetical protein
MPDVRGVFAAQNVLHMNDSEVTMNALTIRLATPSDAEALAALAALDSQDSPRDPVLVGEVAGEIWAAVSLDDYTVLSDPFRPAGEVAWLVVERARQLRTSGRQPGLLGRAFASFRGHAPQPAPRLVH